MLPNTLQCKSSTFKALTGADFHSAGGKVLHDSCQECLFFFYTFGCLRLALDVVVINRGTSHSQKRQHIPMAQSSSTVPLACGKKSPESQNEMG